MLERIWIFEISNMIIISIFELIVKLNTHQDWYQTCLHNRGNNCLQAYSFFPHILCAPAWLKCESELFYLFNTLQSESAYIRTHTNEIISTQRFHIWTSHEKTFPTNTNMSYIPLAVSQQLSSALSGRIAPRERQGKLLIQTAKC